MFMPLAVEIYDGEGPVVESQPALFTPWPSREGAFGIGMRVNGMPTASGGEAVVSRGVLRAVALIGLAGALGIGIGACGSKKKMMPPPDPVTMALQAPGVRTVVVPRQHGALTIVVPPCGLAELKQETTKTPPGSNQVVVPQSALDQTVAIQPCIQGAKTARKSSTILLSPGGAGGAPSASQQASGNQLILPKRSNLAKVVVPPCLVVSASSSSSSSSSSGGQSGTSTVLPAARGKTSVTAPPCQVSMTSSSGGSS
jgi:hypothetical protein